MPEPAATLPTPALAPSTAGSTGGAFTSRELTRVGAATTMMVFGGTVIILLTIMLLGHYNSLAHAGPKAVLDGAVIALLLGQRGRWRCVTLAGVVYGLVLLIQVGLPYLPFVMAFAGLAAAVVGGATAWMGRWVAVLLAAAVFEWAASLGSPLAIYLGTDDHREPFLWGLWFAEWPLRIAGAMVGVVLAWRWVARQEREGMDAVDSEACPLPATSRPRRARTKGVRPAAIRLAVLLAAMITPMFLESWAALLGVNGLVLTYAMALGPRKRALYAALGMGWGAGVFMVASYLWHQDAARAADMFRTFGLRFAPMAMASSVLIGTVRPVDLLRVLRRLRLPGIVLLPLGSVARQLPQAHGEISSGIERLRQKGVWKGPATIVRHPREVLGVILLRPLQRWAAQLVE